ncbi:MAG: hypothetical protein H7Y04_00290 [Verrucomicrobia bacterium]|nr:hypothetical protein [Cytophagales bacterium]
MYTKILFLVLTIMLSLSVFADPGGKQFAEGKKMYDQGKTTEAITLFEQAIIENPERYNSKGNYMIALCYKKADACSKTKTFFQKAYEADPKTGGASSIDKFKEQLAFCKIAFEDLKNTPARTNTDTEPQTRPEEPKVAPQEEKGSGRTALIAGLLTAVGAGGGGYLIYRQMQKKKQQAASNRSYNSDQLYNASEILFDDLLWQKYAEQYGETDVQRVRSSWQLEYSQLVDSKDELGINQLLRKIRQMEASPTSVFGKLNP